MPFIGRPAPRPSTPAPPEPVRLIAEVWWTEDRRFRVTRMDNGRFEVVEVDAVVVVNVSTVDNMRAVRQHITSRREGVH